MLRKLGSTLFLIVCLAVCPLRAQSPGNESAGQTLGGSGKSPIKIEVFSDFQCPACRELYLSTIRKVIDEYSSKDKVCVIYHEYPLAMHAYSKEAARYSEAAARLGQQKLLLVYEVLFQDQAQWGQDGKIDASLSKVLPNEDIQKLKQIMQDSTITAAIEKELQLGNKKEIKSTPTLFISYPGKPPKKVEGNVSYPVMKQFIDNILK
jgi:protein-disulfide isomerase